MKTKQSILILLLPIIAMVVTSCAESSNEPIEPVEYDPTPYAFDAQGLPPPRLPQDNPLTEQGVKLGKMLFNERMLSKDGSQACADCHLQADAFTDTRRFSIGVEGLPGTRQAMSVFNMAWHPPGAPGRPNGGFFWDGRAAQLRDQALMPIQDPLEMNETLENAVAKVQASQTYKDQFVRAFGDDTVTSERMGLAMEQFMLSIVSANSKYDKVQRGEAQYTEAEERGRALYFGEMDPPAGLRGAECFHCHGGPNLTNNQYMNNGLDPVSAWTDLGRYEVTGVERDKAAFKVTTLRNIELTPPYMHDGRFSTLEEVVEHYDNGVVGSPSVDQDLMRFNLRPGGLGLTQQEKSDLIAFLKTLTDPDLATNPEYESN